MNEIKGKIINISEIPNRIYKGKWIKIFESIPIKHTWVYNIKDYSKINNIRVQLYKFNKRRNTDFILRTRKQENNTYKIFIFRKSDLIKKEVIK